MACTLPQITSTTTTTTREVSQDHKGLRRSFSAVDLQRRSGMRRSYSDNHLCYSISPIKAKLKSSRSVGFFNIHHLSSAIIPDSLRSFLFDPETSKEMKMEGSSSDHDRVEAEDEEIGEENEEKKRVNWIERLVELRDNWRGKEGKSGVGLGVYGNDHVGGCDEGGGCDVEYDDDDYEEKGGEMSRVDKETFSSLLRHVSWSDTKMFSQMAFLCNMAYVIPDMKSDDLRRYYSLHLVTSSLEKKAEAEAIKDKVELNNNDFEQIILSGMCSSNAYEIAASAASYVQSRAKYGTDDDPEVDESGGEPAKVVHKSDKMAARVAASTMTAVMAAGDKQKEKAAKDLQSLHSSPCEWFVCDDPSVYTRCFVIKGSDSLASWQANLFFEPTKFEGTNVLVHRGIYEAAKGLYDQFMPEIKQHLTRYGDRAKLQFTGHSLGGSLALLVNLMVLTRNEVKSTSLLPVVTFGSPFIFCGGQKILDELGLDEDHVHSVMMHRDIVPRAFSCNYPDYVAQVLKRLNGTFRFHPCLNKNKLLYSPMGKIFILQPDERSSPPHPLLPPGTAIYTLNNTNTTLTKSAIRAFLNSPHPIETLSDPKAYGSEGTIRRDHDSKNYLKAVNEVIRQHTRLVVRKARKERNQLWPLLNSRSPHAWRHACNIEGRPEEVNEKLLTGV